MEFSIADANIMPVIQRAVFKLAPIARRKEIDLAIDPPGALPAVRIDADKISQVMENLLGNALKFTAGKGRIVITLRSVANGRKAVEIAIKDTGSGIPQDRIEDIFEKYKRVDTAGRRVKGTGLGLSIAKIIVTRHGGEIWAKSTPGEGSTFYFTLPVS